jgi:hypothetical protein
MTTSRGPQWSGRAPDRAHRKMRKRGAQAATTQMGRMGAEAPSSIPSARCLGLTARLGQVLLVSASEILVMPLVASIPRMPPTFELLLRLKVAENLPLVLLGKLKVQSPLASWAL